jgi:serralysin
MISTYIGRRIAFAIVWCLVLLLNVRCYPGSGLKWMTPSPSNKYACRDIVYQGIPLPAREQKRSTSIVINQDGTVSEVGTIRQELAGITDKFWLPGDVINVAFYRSGVSDYVINKIKQYAGVWESYANIRFNYVDDDVDKAHIIISFDTTSGSWSWLGREALFNYNTAFNLPTMNYGWLTDDTPESEFSRVVLHEFGHALGFIHEHQSPTAGIAWDKPKVYDYYKKLAQWDKAMVDAQVFNRYTYSEVTNYSAYDKQSIMHYFFPSDLTIDGYSVPFNTQLSQTDIQYAGRWYPFAPAPNNVSGVLRTGDDCDEIDFQIEYGVVDTSVIEVVLQPGIDPNGNRVNWWKGIKIPRRDGSNWDLEIQDGSSANVTMNKMDIQSSSPLKFAKAKTLGVKTGLAYTWPILHVIPGGCRITLTWRRDRC